MLYDLKGFEILPSDVFGWVHDDRSKQWICYRAGQAFVAVRDDLLINLSPSQRSYIEVTLVQRGAPDLPEEAWRRGN